MWIVVIYSAIAGILGTAAGGALGIIFGEAKNSKTLSYILSFAGGIMISVVCFELIPEAHSLGETLYSHSLSVLFVTLGIAIGITLAIVLDKVADNISTRRLLSAKNLSTQIETEKKELVRSGLVIVFAISMHNFPEGMALGISNTSLAIVLLVLLALHNIPAGMSMSLPLIAGGMKKSTTLLVTAVAGAVTVVGALAGYFIGTISVTVNMLVMSVASGALLYVSFCEILPRAFKTSEGHMSAIFALIGLVLGFVVTFLLHIH